MTNREPRTRKNRAIVLVGSTLFQFSNTPIPSVILNQMGQFNYILALFVFLTGLVCLFIFPPEDSVTTFAKYVRHGMQTGKKESFLGFAAGHIDHRVEQIGSSLTALERLGNQILMPGQMSATMHAAIGSVIIAAVTTATIAASTSA